MNSEQASKKQLQEPTFTSTMGIGLRKNMLGLKLSRLTDASGTYGLLIESPEPISSIRDVTISLSETILKWIPQITVATGKPITATISPLLAALQTEEPVPPTTQTSGT